MEQSFKIKKQKKRIDYPYINNSQRPKPFKVGLMEDDILINTAKIESKPNMPKKKPVLSTKQIIQDMTRYKKTVNVAHPKQKEPFKVVYPVRKIRERTGFTGISIKDKKEKTDSMDRQGSYSSYKIRHKLHSKGNNSNSSSGPLKINNKKDMARGQERSNQSIKNAKMILNRYAIKPQAHVRDETKLERILLGPRELEKNLKDTVETDNEETVLQEKKDIQSHPILYTEKSKLNLDEHDVPESNSKHSDNLSSQSSNKYIIEDTCFKPTDNNSYHQPSIKPITTKPEEMSDRFDAHRRASNIDEVLKRYDKIEKPEDSVSRDIRNYVKELNAKEQTIIDKFDNKEKNNKEIGNKVHVKNELRSNQPVEAHVTDNYFQRYPAYSNKSVNKQNCDNIQTNNDMLIENPSSTTIFPKMNKNNLLENFKKNDSRSAQVINGNKEKIQKILFKYKSKNPEQTLELVYKKSEEAPNQNSDEFNKQKANLENEFQSNLPALPARPVSKYIRKIKETNIKTKKEPTNEEESLISTMALLEKVREASKLKTAPGMKAVQQNTTPKEELRPCANRKLINSVSSCLYQKVKLAEEIKIRMSNYRAKSKPKKSGSEFKEDIGTRNLSEKGTSKNITKSVRNAEGYKSTAEDNDMVPLKIYLKENKVTPYATQKCINNSREDEKDVLEKETEILENETYSIEDSKNEVTKRKPENSSGLQGNSKDNEQVLSEEKKLVVSEASESETSELQKLAVDPSSDMNRMIPDVTVVDSKANSSKKRGKTQLRSKTYNNLKAKNSKGKSDGNTSNVTLYAYQNKRNSKEIDEKIGSDEIKLLELAIPERSTNNYKFGIKDKAEFEQIPNSAEIIHPEVETKELEKEKKESKTMNDLHLLKEASRKDRSVFKDSKQILLPRRSVARSELQKKNENRKRNERLKSSKDILSEGVTTNKPNVVSDNGTDKSVISENMNMTKQKTERKSPLEEKKVDGSSDTYMEEEKLRMKEESKKFSTSSSKLVDKPKICSEVRGDYNEIKSVTGDETISPTFKTLEDSYLLNLKKRNRSSKQDKIEWFQSGENLSDHVRINEDTNNDSIRIDIVDHFQLLKEISNKARASLKNYNETNTLQKDKKYKQKGMNPIHSDEVNVTKHSEETKNKLSIGNNDKVMTSSSTGGKDTTSDISVDQPFIRKELPRPSPKRDDRSKKEPPKTNTGIKLPPPKNQEGSKLDDDVVKTVQTPKPQLELNMEDNIKQELVKDKLIRKNTKDLKKLILLKKDENMRDEFECKVGFIDDRKSDYKDGPDPNVIKQAKVYNIENQKKRVAIIDGIAEDPLKSSSNFNYSHKRTSGNNESLEQNESMKQEKPQECLIRRQQLPIHIVRKLMKIKRQRDKGKQYDRVAEYEKFLDIVTNPQETIIQKPDWKSNHSDSSLMKIYLLDDDSKTENEKLSSKNTHYAVDIKKEARESEVSKVKEPRISGAEQVLNSLKPDNHSVKYKKNSETSPSPPTSPLKDKSTKTKKNMSMTKKDNSSEKFIVDVSDMKQKKSLLLIFNAEKPDSKSQPKNLSEATFNTKQSEKEEIKKGSTTPDALYKVESEQICGGNTKINQKKFNVKEKLGSVSPNQTKSGKKSVVFVLKNSSPYEKLPSPKSVTNKNLKTKNAWESMPIIDDRDKVMNESALCRSDEDTYRKTKKLIDTFEMKKTSKKPCVSNSACKYNNTILKLEECFNRIVKKLKNLDEKGKLVKNVVSNVNGMVSNCTNKFLEELFDKKALDKQNQIELERNQNKKNIGKHGKQDLETNTTDPQIIKNTKCQISLPANFINKMEPPSVKQTHSQLKMDERNQLSSQHKQETPHGKELILGNKEDKHRTTTQIGEHIKPTVPQNKVENRVQKHPQIKMIDNKPISDFEIKSNEENEENIGRNATGNFRIDTDVMTVIKRSLYADDLLKKTEDQNIDTSQLTYVNTNDKTEENNILPKKNKSASEFDKIIVETGATTQDTDKIDNKKLRNEKDLYIVGNKVQSIQDEGIIEVENKSIDTNKNLDFYNFRDSSDNSLTKNVLELKENEINHHEIALPKLKHVNEISKVVGDVLTSIEDKNNTEVNPASDEDKGNLEDVLHQDIIHNATMKHIEKMNSDIKTNKVRAVMVANSSGEIKTLKGSSRIDKNRKGTTVLTENNIVKIIVQTQTANIVITNNEGFNSKPSKSKRSPSLEVAIKKLKEDVGGSLTNEKIKPIESLFKDADSMKKLVSKVSETIKIIGDMDICDKDLPEDKNVQQNTITLANLEDHSTAETKMSPSSNKKFDIISKIQSKEDNDTISDVHENDKVFMYKNVNNGNTNSTTSDQLKLKQIVDGHRLKPSEELIRTLKEHSTGTTSKTAAKSLEQLNKEECTRYCFADYDYSYAKRRAKRQLDKKLCKLDSDEFCFRAYFSSVEKRLKNEVPERSHSIKFHRRRVIDRKCVNETNLNLNRSYSTTSNAILSQNNILTIKHENIVKKCIHALYKENIENKRSIQEFKRKLLNKDRIVPILSDKDGDEPNKPPDNKTSKEDDKNKKSDKASKKTVFKIVRAPIIHRSGRRYTKSAKLKSRKHKTEDSKKTFKPTHHGRRNVIMYILQNQFNNKINKQNFKAETKVLNPKKEVEETINKFKVDITHDNDSDFHTVSITDTELYKEKRSRSNVYRSDILNSKTKTEQTVRTSVSDFDKKSTDPSGHKRVEVDTKINLGDTKENKILKNNDAISLDTSTDKRVSTSKYLLEKQASLYKKHSAEFKAQQILNTQSVLKSTISQKSTSEHPVDTFTKRKSSSKSEKSGSKTANDKAIESSKSDDKETPKASLDNAASKSKTFREILGDELAIIFKKGPQDYIKPDKLVAKVEEFVDNKDMKLQKFNKKLRSYTDLNSTSKGEIEPPCDKSESFVSNNCTNPKYVETHESTNISTSVPNLMHSKITIEKDLGNSTPAREFRKTFANGKKECEVVRIPPKSLFQIIYSLPNENDTTLTKRSVEKIMSVRKLRFGRYPGVKITYVVTNKGDSDMPLENFSAHTAKTNLSKEAVTQCVLSVRYEILKKLHDEFNKQQSFNDTLEINKTKLDLNESESHSENYKDDASHTTEYSCLEKGSNQSLIDDKITSDVSSNMNSNERTRNSLESFLKTWLIKIGAAPKTDEKDPKK